MSQPKRYLGMVRVHPPKDGEYRVEHIESEHGSWVSYDDYAALAAENERLKVEVKRLTTAIKTADRIIKPMRDAAAKEGRDAK